MLLLSTKLFSQLADILFFAENKQVLILYKLPLARNDGVNRAPVFGCKHAEVIFNSEIQLLDGLADPFIKHINFKNRIIAAEIDIIEDMLAALTNRIALSHVLFGINNGISAVAEQKLLLNVSVCLADNLFCAAFFEQVGYFKAVLKVFADADKAGVKRRNIKGFQHLNFRAVAYFCADDIRKHILNGFLFFVNYHYFTVFFCEAFAKMMAEALEPFYKTAYLTGKNDTGERVRAYEDLQSDREGTLEVLCAVDILNEGVDIPGVNMVLFLRPTESSTIFIQQLGRGLRKYDNKDYIPVVDFIGNNYKRSAQIALALGGLAQKFVMEKRLLVALVRDDFKPLGLEQYGVEINIDSLSKEEILNYVENENFYSLKYMKQDYNNFKKYINSPTYPKHMDYLNSDSAPDLLKFMQIKIGNKKTNSYYGFLKGIEEENLVEFNAEQENVINYLSGLLQLVRPHDYLICKFLLEGDSSISLIEEKVKYEVQNYNEVEFFHALKYLAKRHIVIADGDTLSLGCERNNEFNNYLVDLLEYGLTKYKADYANNTGMFLLWNDYRYDQVQIKRCINPGYTAVGTYYGAEGDVYIFASIKKDVAEGMEHLNYKDKFLEPSVFQWECKANISDGELNKLKTSKYAHLFIRKVESENGITLPFTYVGIGHLDNPRQSQNEERKRTFIFDIHMEEELPDYLQYDFGLTN